MKTIEYKKQYKEFGEEVDNAMYHFDNLYTQCSDCLDEIGKINSHFAASFTASVVETDF